MNIGVNIEFRELKIAQFGTTEESIDGTHTCSNTDQFLSQAKELQVKRWFSPPVAGHSCRRRRRFKKPASPPPGFVGEEEELSTEEISRVWVTGSALYVWKIWAAPLHFGIWQPALHFGPRVAFSVR